MDEFSNGKLPPKQVFGYLMGMIPMTLFGGFFSLVYTKFFYHDLGIAQGYWYAGLIIYAVVNAFNDPLIGNMSDNTDVKKWGSRRIVYIKYGGPVLAFLFVIIWWIPTEKITEMIIRWIPTLTYPDLYQFILFLHFVLTICFYETFFTLVIMTWYALLPDMTTDVDERTRVNFIGSIITLIFGIPMLFAAGLEHQQIKNWSLVIGAIGVISYVFVVKFSKERPEYQHDEKIPLKKAIKLALKSKGYRVFMGYNFMNSLSGSLTAAFLYLFWFYLGDQNILAYFGIIIVIGYGSNMICMSLRKKYGVVKLVMFYGIMKIIGGVATFAFAMFPATEKLIWVGFIWTTFFSGAGVFSYVLQTLPIDEDELISGKRREGIFFGINALFTMPAQSFGPMLGTAIMGIFGYLQNVEAEGQPAEVFTGVKIMFFLIPAIFTFFSLLIVQHYPLDGENLVRMHEQLDELHEEKKQTLAQAR